MTAGIGYPGIYVPSVNGGALDLPSSYAYNGLLNWQSVTTVRIGPGYFRDDTDSVDIINLANQDVDISTPGANGRNADTAEQSNKWYAFCLIKNLTTGAVAGFAINQDDIGSFTYPSGYSVKRIIGWFRNNGSGDLRKADYFGNGTFRICLYDVEITELTALSGGSATSYTTVGFGEWIPPLRNVIKLNALFDPSATSFMQFRPGGSSVTNPATFYNESVAASNATFDALLNASRQLQYRVNNAADTLDLYVVGYYDYL